MTIVKAVFWDFGGVITSSPFEAFERYEIQEGIEPGAIRQINSNNLYTNAWAKLERNEINREDFCREFEAEALEFGFELSGAKVLACLAGAPRPMMVRALREVRRHYKVACLTNNVVRSPRPPSQEAELTEIMGLFHHVVESSKIGVRKPEKGFYEHALSLAGVSANQTVFLDDLGVNLKTAREMGMTTIKVTEPAKALADLGAALGMNLLELG